MATFEYSPIDSEPRDTSSLDAKEYERQRILSELTVTKTVGRQAFWTILTISACNAVIFLVSLSLFTTWFYQTHYLLNADFRRTSTYSPIYDLLDLEPKTIKINGTLFPSKMHPSLARHAPSPETDTIWEEWELTRVFPVTAQQIRDMGKDPATAAKLEDADWGLGDDAYAATFDVYHQLHCLNFLRKLIYPNNYNKSNWHHADIEGFFEIHMNHCVDIIMQTLQCSGNLNLITMHWVEAQPYPFPDMSVNRQCVNFDKLTQFRRDNTIDMDKYVEMMKKPMGVTQLRAPDGYYEYLAPDVPNPNHMGSTWADEDEYNL